MNVIEYSKSAPTMFTIWGINNGQYEFVRNVNLLSTAQAVIRREQKIYNNVFQRWEN